ncbi:protein-L-isoaspartate O-methyltransferase family protein [Thiocystis violascens]|uniref:Protein-L-isoaspartate O-methyltransferase n=1 Tax=Thiocystis violascens (strain ATCC 17096 / DSM 198 / 6111) TaxID=765911 RepID=I3Y9Q4_THIV6|nr:protein-L-isoaspartate O-methyltransferase [Thiocystis violascens]AFL73722.1 protein-L-isoaspartate carboxylmethyltransferase [Thiocystis violascens DSM 198]
MDNRFDLARFNMIQQQIRPWDVLDEHVLDAMAAIAREAFVPDAYRGLAYADIEIPIGTGTSMLDPKVVGRLLQALDVRPGEKVLEIGTGTGYVTACLSRLGGRVISVEIDPALAAAARERLAALKFAGVEVREGDGLAGPIAGGPFEAIAVTGSMPTDASLPMLQDHLSVGGRLFCIVGEEPVMEALLITRLGGRNFSRETLFETCVPSLAKVVEPESFVF